MKLTASVSAVRVFFGRFLGVLLAVWAFGCSKGSDAPVQRTSVEGLAPATVTLSVPNPLSPIAPVLQASTTVKIGARADVVSGTVIAMSSVSGSFDADPDALLNDVWSRGRAVLRDRVRVRGTLFAKQRTLGIGTINPNWNQNPVFDPPATLSWVVTYPAGTATDVTLNIGQTLRLDPGLHGRVQLNSGSTLTLGAGTYYLTGLNVEADSSVKLDQASGPVIVYVAENIALRGRFSSLSGAAPDLLIGYLGTNGVFVERLVFDGAIVAPLASLTLRSVTGTHTGFFAAKSQFLDAGAKVRYRVPLAVIKAAEPPNCKEMVQALVPSADLSRYCRTCFTRDDTDRDGTKDCDDQCPYDPDKVLPGACNCGTPDTDRDGDLVKDCHDKCPDDPNNTAPGQCGCQGLPGLVLANTPCADSPCAVTGATCDGAGVCGNRNGCRPAANCRFVNTTQSSYWICPGPSTRAAAQTACSGRGMTLARIDSTTENRFLSGVTSAQAWIGANSLASSSAWRWSSNTTNNGDQFWSGGATGQQENDFYSSWRAGSPSGSGRCGVFDPVDGRWFAADCNQTRGYVCEFRIPITGGDLDIPGDIGDPPVGEDCVDEAVSGLPEDGNLLLLQIAAAENEEFTGAAANPPAPGSVCPHDPEANMVGNLADGANCTLTEVVTDFECFKDADCEQFDPDFECRQVKDDPDCQAPSGPGAPTTPVRDLICKGHARCGRVVCPPDICENGEVCACDQVEVCNPDSEFTHTDPDDGSDLEAEEFNPADLFDAPPVTTPSPAYVDPHDGAGTGKNHAWCTMRPQNDLPAADQPTKNKGGQSGGSSRIRFGFDPDLIFDVDANPLSLGESDLNIHAAAKFVATVELRNFLGKNYTAPIIDVGAGLKVERCAISNDETSLQLFGLDAVDPGVFTFNTGDLESEFCEEHPNMCAVTETCNETLGEFIVFANRVKKAFRDAQQLLQQYHALKGAGGLQNFCAQTLELLGNDIQFFPGGLTCYENEPVEITINRFLDYYQGPGTGQVAQMRGAIQKLSDATQKLRDLLDLPDFHLKFVDLKRQESRTILNVPFAIGPVPAVLQIDIFYRYGIAGAFDLELDFPFSLNTPVGKPLPVAHAKAGVLPYAAAGLSAFVGAGGGLGGFSATLGIEGRVSLAKVEVPIFAGAGLDVTVTDDIRPIPTDIAPPMALATNAFQFGIPKAFKFSVWYDYGAAVDLKEVLSGEINSALRIKFFFFSRTWRKRVVKFNGWSRHFDLVSGSFGRNASVGKGPATVSAIGHDTASATTTAVQGNTDIGLSESQVPLMVLAPLEAPVGPVADGTVPFDATNVEKLFYDDLCCSKPGEECAMKGAPACCPGSECMIPEGSSSTTTGVCEQQCRKPGESCEAQADCCGAPFTEVQCSTFEVCDACGIANFPCTTDLDCCTPSFVCGNQGKCTSTIIFE